MEFASNSVVSFEDAMLITMTIFSILQPQTGAFSKVSDSRIAAAISSGLLELCLDFCSRYGEHTDPHPDTEDHMITYLWHLASSAHVSALHRRSFKAINRRLGPIQKALSDLGVTEKKLYLPAADQTDKSSVPSTAENTFFIGWENKYPGNTKRCKEVIQSVKSALYLSTTCCCQCLKTIKASVVKRCSNCQRTVYVSARCMFFELLFESCHDLKSHSLACTPTGARSAHVSAKWLTGRLVGTSWIANKWQSLVRKLSKETEKKTSKRHTSWKETSLWLVTN